MDTKIIVAGAVVVVLVLAFVLMSGKPATTTPQPAEQPAATFDASEVDAGDSVDDQDLIVDETVPEEP